MNNPTTSAILAWYDHPSRLHLAGSTGEVFANSRHLDEAALLAALEVAIWKDTQALGPRSAAAQFDELAVLTVVLRARVEPALVATSQKLLRGGPLVETLEALTCEGCLDLVHRVVRSVAEMDVLGGVEHVCLRHAADLAEWGWENELSARIPVYVALILDAVDRGNAPSVLMALAALKAFGEVNAVPSTKQKVTLMHAVRAPSSTVDEAALTRFLLALANGDCFMELACAAAATRHEPLLAEFAGVAPPKAIEWLREQLDTSALPGGRLVGIA